MGVKTVFVIIVTYNGKYWYDQCFGSLRKSEMPIQTIVVDNASSDDTVAYIKENYPEIVLIESDKNLGFGQANNIGMRYALEHGADYVFLLNQDAWIEPNTIAELAKISKNNPEYGILSPMHLNAAKTSIEKGLLIYISDNKITDKELINNLYFNQLKGLYDTKYVNAAAWLLPRKTLETVGGFDPIFFHNGEDDNYIQRVEYHKFKIGICPLIQIIHDTTRRVVAPKFPQSYEERCQLVRVANININCSIYSVIVHQLYKALINLLKGNIAQMRQLINYAKYVFIMRKAIKYSKVNNKRKKTNWL